MTITGVNWLSIYLGVSLGVVGGLILGVMLTTVLDYLQPLLRRFKCKLKALWKDKKGVLHSSSYREGTSVTVTVGDANRPKGALINDNVQYIGHGGGGAMGYYTGTAGSGGVGGGAGWESYAFYRGIGGQHTSNSRHCVCGWTTAMNNNYPPKKCLHCGRPFYTGIEEQAGACGPGIIGMLDKNGVFHKIDIKAWNYALKECK